MKTRLLFPLTASLTLLFVSIGCKKDAVQADGSNEANLTIETVKGPKKDACGGFDWDVKFKLKNASTKGGWIVQKITRDPAIYTCPGDVVDITPLTYWEAWRIMPGKDGDSGRAAGLFDYDDKFREPDHPDTRGSLSFSGEVKFYEDQALPATFQRNNPGTYAGGLPSTTEKPAFWDGKEAAPHTLTTIWNCCANPAISYLVIIPRENGHYQAGNAGDTSLLDNTGKLIHRITAWTDGYYTGATQSLIYIARQIKNSTSISGLRNSISLYQSVYTGKNGYIDEMSKVYLLLRTIYQLPQSIPYNRARVFGGWLNPSIGKRNTAFDISWPVFMTQNAYGLQANIAKFPGFVGRAYDAVGEFDYFTENFPARNL